MTLDGLFRALNPYAKFSTPVEAAKAARLGSVALLGTAIQNIVSTVFQRSDAEELKALMVRAQGPVSLETAVVNETLYSQLIPIVTVVFWVVMVLTITLCCTLAWVQWRKLTRIIPLFYLMVVGIGFATIISTVMDPYKRVLALNTPSVVQSIAALLLAMLMFTAYRGASQYHAMQGDKT